MPKLITVSGKSVELAANSSYVFGRDPSCDVVVEDRSCSRNHARIVVSDLGDTSYLEDLGSRNGTFLDGRRVHELTMIEDGAQVRMGSTIFVVSDSEHEIIDGPETRELERSETLFLQDAVIAELPGLGEELKDSGITGQLASLGLPEVLQLLTQTRRNGILYLHVAGDRGEIHLRRGDVVSARHAELTGIDAICALAAYEEGRFEFVEGEAGHQARDINRPTQDLLLEICRRLDESTFIEGSSLVDRMNIEGSTLVDRMNIVEGESA